jgi:hypothetical protein
MCTLTKEPTFQNKRFIGNRKKFNETNDHEGEEQEVKEEEKEDQHENNKRPNLERFETETINYDLMSNIETFGVGDAGLEQKRRKSDVEGVHFDKNLKFSEIEMKNEDDKKESKTNLKSIDEDASDEEEEDNLVIDVPEIIEKKNEEEDGEIMGPASPEKIDSPRNNLQIDSKTTEEAKIFNPKVIPLEKPELESKIPSSSNSQSTIIASKSIF